MTNLKKPTDKIRSPQKISVGLIILLLMVVFVFVFFEERQRGLALLVGIPLSGCLVYFIFLYLGDRDSMKIYKTYLLEKRKTAIELDIKYEFKPSSEVWIQNPGGTKIFALLLTALIFVVALGLFSTRSRFGGIVLLLDVALLGAYVWLEDQESKLIEQEIEYIEKKYSADFFADNKNRIVNKTKNKEIETEET